MNTLALLNNLEREFSRPFFRSPSREMWLAEPSESRAAFYNSELAYDEKTSTWKLTLELAGVTKENIKVATEEGLIHVTGEKTKGVNLGKFEAKYDLPENVDTEKIEAVFEDGVLTVAMPLIAKKTAKAIEIK